MNILSITLLTCIYLGNSFPFDINPSTQEETIKNLLRKGYIEEDLSDCVTGYRETSKGKDLRVSEKGYVKYHHNKDIRECVHLIKESSEELNEWLEKLFS